MIELLFILGFTLHNIEEALWLPDWSKHAKKFHQQVSKNQFHFAVIVITAIGYLFTFQYLIWGKTSNISKYIYLGFVFMMVANVFFPHLIATFILKRYTPGLLTGVLLNAPIGIFIIYHNIYNTSDLKYLLVSGIIVSVTILSLLKPLFMLGGQLFDKTKEI